MIGMCILLVSIDFVDKQTTNTWEWVQSEGNRWVSSKYFVARFFTSVYMWVSDTIILWQFFFLWFFHTNLDLSKPAEVIFFFFTKELWALKHLNLMTTIICEYHHQRILSNPDLLSPAVLNLLNSIMDVVSFK